MELYCIKTHPKKIVVEGKIYPLLNDKSPCKCNAINVGALDKTYPPIVMCGTCGVSYKNDGYWWVHRERFANIDDINIEEAIECINELQTV